MCVNVPKKVEMFETLNHVQQHGQTSESICQAVETQAFDETSLGQTTPNKATYQVNANQDLYSLIV